MSRFPLFSLVFVPFAIWAPISNVKADPPVADEKLPPKRLTLPGLAKLYQDLGLPIPPKNAGFAIMDSGLPPWRFREEAPHPEHALRSAYRFRFAIKDPKLQGQYRVWNGFEARSEKRIEQFQRTTPEPEAVLQVMKMDRLDCDRDAPTDTDLIFAIQCQILGHHQLADFFYQRCLNATTRKLVALLT